MALQEKQLGQARENSTNAVSVYSPAASTTAVVKNITITNTTGSAVDASLFVDDDGTTYDESTALLYQKSVPANDYIEYTGFVAMNNENGNIAYQSGTANALTITIFGAEIT